jgi:hypothetical protein
VDKTRDFILEGLSRFDLADLPGRPYDCAFDLLAATPSRKRLIMMGFNGSLADSCMTNRQSILQDYAHLLFQVFNKGYKESGGSLILKDYSKYLLASVIAGRCYLYQRINDVFSECCNPEKEAACHDTDNE